MGASIARQHRTVPSTARFLEKREAVLGAAAALFNDRGIKGATLADIAAGVGLATNSITYYYRKKEDLATACFLRAIGVFDAVMAEAAAQPSVEARLRCFFERHARTLQAIRTGERSPLIYFNDIRALPDAQAGEVFAAYTEMFRRMRRLLDGPETAGLTRAALNARAHLVISVAHWVRAWIGRYEAEDYPRVASAVADLLLRGIGGERARWPVAAISLGALQPEGGDTPGEAFLRAATALVNEQGYRGASVDRISARLNVTKGSFYHHHDRKQDLIAACFERTFGVLRQALREAEAVPGRGWDRLAALAIALARFQLSAQGPLLRATATSALPDPDQRAQVRRTLQGLTERVAAVIVDGMVDGSIRPLDPGIAAQIASAAINAAAELQRWVPGVTMANAADLYVRPALEGVLCGAAAAQ